MIPAWLIEKLASPPQAGTGIHAWLFACARQLHAHMPAGAIEAALAAATAGSARRIPASEIRDAVRNSQAVAWTPEPNGAARESHAGQPLPHAIRQMPALARWPKCDLATRRCYGDGNGCGYGDGYGNGYGDGNGCGYGDGYGYG